MKLTVNYDAEALEERKESHYITRSGMYDVVLKHVWIDVNGKSQVISMQIEWEGQENTLFSTIRLTNRDGKPNFQCGVWQRLCCVCGIKNGQDLVTKKATINVGSKEIEIEELVDFQDLECTLRIAMNYSLYNGKIYQSKQIHNCFRKGDHASASEMMNKDGVIGNQYELELEKADKDVYGKGITEAMVKEWKDADYGRKTVDNVTEPKGDDVGDDIPF